MCGIVGGINLSDNEVKSMLLSIEHRGIDNFHVKRINNIHIGVNVLPLFNDEYNTQPVFNQDIGIVFNGQIYNSSSLAKKYDLRENETELDTNIVAELIQKGAINYNMLDGQFSFIIAKDNCLTLVRDYPGIVPLFYSKEGNKIGVSSECNSLTEIGFHDIRKVLPGTQVVLSEKEIKESIWLELNEMHINNSLKELDRLFKKVIKSQVTHGKIKKKIGVMLSGGVDSALLLAYLKQYNEDITAFTIDCMDLKYAVEVCEYLNVKQEIIKMNHEQINKYSKTYDFSHQGEKFFNLNKSLYVPTAIIAEIAKEKGIEIMFSGDGIDEIFWGYDIYNQYSINRDFISRKIIDLMYEFSLERMDLAMMQKTIEVRVPFVNKAIIEFAMSLDEEVKMNDKAGKWIIRKLAEKYLPTSIAWREKIPMQVSTNSYEGVNGAKWEGDIFS